MKTVAALALALSALALGSAPATAADVSAVGTWDMVAETPNGPMPSVLVLKKVEGKLKAGANNVSVSIDAPQRMSFLSEAGFDAGVARGPEFQIIANTARELVASYFDGSSINTFVLNKSNGLAIWSKIRATFPVYDAPTGGQSFLACQ